LANAVYSAERFLYIAENGNRNGNDNGNENENENGNGNDNDNGNENENGNGMYRIEDLIDYQTKSFFETW